MWLLLQPISFLRKLIVGSSSRITPKLYAEPESTTYLAYQTSFIAFNKTDAAEQLLKIEEDADLEEMLRKISANRSSSSHMLLKRHMNGELPVDLRFTVKTAEELLAYDDGVDDDLFRSETKVYLGKRMGLYAYEDKLDQPLCRLAAKLGYDLVVLTSTVKTISIAYR